MKKLLSFATALCISLLVLAEPISPNVAQLRALSFLKTIGVGNYQSLKSVDTPISRAKVKGAVIPDYYYVFNIGEGKGYVIASGDNHAPAVLGYSDSGYFDTDNLPENLKAWLVGYTEQIAYIQKNKLNVGNHVAATGRTAISPLLTTLWGQDSPYNNDCGLDLTIGHINCVTGCVATAMAQVMNYYKYPNATIAEIPSYRITYNGTDVIDFPVIPANTPINWANMKDDYDDGNATSKQKKAVAELMHYCGLAVKMRYSGRSSGAFSTDVAPALKKYFGYSPATRYIKRENFSWSEWDKIMYDELANQHPVYYSGSTSTQAGHAFVVDGYQTNGYYHVNWGWEGTSNGYYLLSLLTPEEQGTGGSDEGYNFEQAAVLTSINGEEYEEDVRLTTSAIELSNGDSFTRSSASQDFTNVGFKWTVKSTLSDTYDIDMNFALYKGDEFIKYLTTNRTINGFENTYVLTTSFSGSFFRNLTGTYRIVGVSKKHGTENWKINNKSKDYYITANITTTSLKLTVNTPGNTEEITDAERETLANLYKQVKNQAQETLDNYNANTQIANHINEIQNAIDGFSTQLTALMTSINAVSKKITDSNFSSAQKQVYQSTLNELKKKYDAYKTTIGQLQKQLTVIKNLYTSLPSTLTAIKNEAANQITSIDNITTALAYEMALSHVYELMVQLEGYGTDEVDSQLDKLDTDVAGVENNLATLEASINGLSSEIDGTVPNTTTVNSFTLHCKRGYVGYNGSQLYGTTQANASELAIIDYGNTNYLYDATHKTFVIHTTAARASTTGNNALESKTDFSKAVTGLTWGETGFADYPWYLEDCYGNWLNMDNIPRVYMNTWKNFENGNGGNTYQVTIVNPEFDATEALELLESFFHLTNNVVYVFTEPGNIVTYSQKFPTTSGTVIQELPDELRKDYCSYEVTATTMKAGENTVDVRVSYELPFTVSTNYETATWYYAKIRNNYYINIGNSEPYYPTATQQTTDNFQWAFKGTPHTGFVILNKAAGSDMGLKAVDGNVVMRDENIDRWELIKNGSGFNWLRIGSIQDYINQFGGSSGKLGIWTDSRGRNDTGGQWLIEEVTTGIESIEQNTIANDVWYTVDGRRFNTLPSRPGVYIRRGRKVLVK